MDSKTVFFFFFFFLTRHMHLNIGRGREGPFFSDFYISQTLPCDDMMGAAEGAS